MDRRIPSTKLEGSGPVKVHVIKTDNKKQVNKKQVSQRDRQTDRHTGRQRCSERLRDRSIDVELTCLKQERCADA